MRINPILYGVLVLSVFFGTILGFQAAGIWSTSGKVDASGKEIQPTPGDVDSIKGWMTLEQVSTAFNVPLEEILAQFDLPADTLPDTAIKDLESVTFDATALKDWLAAQAQPAVPPQSANATPSLTQPAEAVPQASLEPTPGPTEHAQPELTITGKTTFQDLLDWGITVETIQEVIGDDMPVPSTVIKDYVIGKGMEFSTIKTEFQSEVDQLR